MSEQRKRARLSDDGVLMFWGAPTSSDLHALKRDHLQAREDRKRLAARLRKITKFGRGHDDGCLYWYDGSTPPGCDCETGRLLAEVDPQ